MPEAEEKSKSQMRRAVDEIRALIVSNELPANSMHLESELAERLGMSRTPVREASLVLEAQGLVELRPRKGLKVLALSPTDMREVYEILTELESLAAERAAQAELSEADLRGLAKAIDRMERALKKEDREAWAEADEAFHNELVRLGGNARVANIVEMYNDQVRRARAITLYMRPLPTKSNDDHRALYEAIRAHEPEKARKIHRAHRTGAKKLLTELLARHGLRSI